MAAVYQLRQAGRVAQTSSPSKRNLLALALPVLLLVLVVLFMQFFGVVHD